MQNGDEIYQELLAALSREFPDLAEQVLEEVNRGQLVTGTKLPDEDRIQRQTRLADADLPKLGKNDLAMLPYGDDERLALLCEALLTLARTMAESRRAVLKLANSHDLAYTDIQFVDPTTGVGTEVDLAIQVEQTDQIYGIVAEILRPVQEEVGRWH